MIARNNHGETIMYIKLKAIYVLILFSMNLFANPESENYKKNEEQLAAQILSANYNEVVKSYGLIPVSQNSKGELFDPKEFYKNKDKTRDELIKILSNALKEKGSINHLLERLVKSNEETQKIFLNTFEEYKNQSINNDSLNELVTDSISSFSTGTRLSEDNFKELLKLFSSGNHLNLEELYCSSVENLLNAEDSNCYSLDAEQEWAAKIPELKRIIIHLKDKIGNAPIYCKGIPVDRYIVAMKEFIERNKATLPGYVRNLCQGHIKEKDLLALVIQKDKENVFNEVEGNNQKIKLGKYINKSFKLTVDGQEMDLKVHYRSCSEDGDISEETLKKYAINLFDVKSWYVQKNKYVFHEYKSKCGGEFHFTTDTPITTNSNPKIELTPVQNRRQIR